MKRRDFIVLTASGIAGWPLLAHGDSSGRIWRMGFLAQGYEKFYDALFDGLKDLGYQEGRNLLVERRYAEGRNERFAEFAAEFVRLKVDVIVTAGSAGHAAKQATSTIPIVLGVASDPVGDGLV